MRGARIAVVAGIAALVVAAGMFALRRSPRTEAPGAPPRPSGEGRPTAARPHATVEDAEKEELRRRLAEAERQVALLTKQAAVGAGARPQATAEPERPSSAEPQEEARRPLDPAGKARFQKEQARSGGEVEEIRSQAKNREWVDALLRLHGDYVEKRSTLLRRYLLGEIDRETFLGMNRTFYEQSLTRARSELGPEAAGLYQAVTFAGRIRFPEDRPPPGAARKPPRERREPEPLPGRPRVAQLTLTQREGARFAADLAIDDGAGILSAMVTLTVDPQAITLESLGPGPGLPQGFQVIAAVNPEKGLAAGFLLGPIRRDRPTLPAGPLRLMTLQGAVRHGPATVELSSVRVEIGGRLGAAVGQGLDLP